MLAMAIRAVRRIADAGFKRFAMHAFIELPRYFFVALRAGACYLPMAYRGLRIARGENAVAAVAIGTNGGILAFGAPPGRERFANTARRDGGPESCGATRIPDWHDTGRKLLAGFSLRPSRHHRWKPGFCARGRDKRGRWEH